MTVIDMTSRQYERKHWAMVLVSCWDQPVINPSHFERALMALIEAADSGNRDLIGKGYPIIVELANAWNKVPGASDEIRALARS